MHSRIVCTGMGAVCALGNNVESIWSSLLAGNCGIHKLHDEALEGRPSCAAHIPVSEIAALGLPSLWTRGVDPFIAFGLKAAQEAIAQAGLETDDTILKPRVAVLVGSGIGGLHTIEENALRMHTRGARRISPYFVPASIINMLAGHISIHYGFSGVSFAPVSACASGAHAIALAKRLLEWGDADVVIAGAAEAASTALGMGGFAAMRALSDEADPTQACRPFDKTRRGFILGDGAAVLVLEREEHARARQAPILAHVLGQGMTSDAYHMTQPSGEGAQRAMHMALEDAALEASDIAYVNAHATGTMIGDAQEAAALEAVFAGVPVHVSGTKGQTGHLLGASGALEAVFTMQALRTGVLPATYGLQSPLQSSLSLLTSPHQGSFRYAMSNAFAFGGMNVALVFGSDNASL